MLQVFLISELIILFAFSLQVSILFVLVSAKISGGR
jgi:hypothetical protein